jgi:3-hydroxyacyl-[acyl-carrier-protein] dehydratase
MSEQATGSMDIHEILEHLPHRYPFVLVDRVLSLEVNKEIVAIKNVSVNEPYFPGHFPYHRHAWRVNYRSISASGGNFII